MKRRMESVLTTLVVCALLVSAGISFGAYERESVAIIKDNLYDSLRDLASQQNAALKAEFGGILEVMNTLASAVSGQDGDAAGVNALLTQAAQSNLFAYAGVVDAQGEGHGSDGAPVAKGALGREALEAPTARYAQGKDQAYFVFTAPVEGAGAVFACCPEARFVDLLATRAMSERSYAFIANSGGEVIVHSNHPSYVNISGNILTFYEEVIMENGASQEQARKDLQEGRAGMLAYTYGNQYRYVSYAPVGVNDWFLFSVVDGNQVDGQVTQSRRLLIKLAAKLAAIAVAVAALWMLWDRRREREMKRLCEQTHQSEELRRMAEQLSYTILFEADPATGQIQYNDAFERQLGRKPQIVNFNDFLKDEVPMPPEEAQAWRRLAEEMKRGLPKSQVSVQLPHSNGERIWYRVSFQTLYNKDKSAPVRIVGRFANIERQEREQDKQLAQAERDELTGLMGHMAFMQRGAKRLSREGACALLIADIDGYKGARDIDGRYQGDQLLVRMSEAMRQVFAEGDLLGRLGGDTFAVLMAGGATAEDVAQRAGALCEAFEGEDGHTCSVGIAMSGKGADTISELSHRADKALYRAKLAGKHRFEFYEGMVAEHLSGQGRGDDAGQVLKRCAVALLASDALAVGMDEVLREIAQYYRADRAYVMQLNADTGEMFETYSWCAPGCEPPVDRRLMMMENSRMALALKEHHTLSVPEINERTVSDPQELKALLLRKVTALYMAPMSKAGFQGFLGIENPRDHVGGATVLKQVASCVVCALNKLEKK